MSRSSIRRLLHLGLAPVALALVVALAGIPALRADDAGDAAIAAFKTAMAGQDSDAKRQAIRALASKSVGSDDDVLPLLVSAVSDRQGGETAIQALRDRTGLTPPPYVGQSHYPAYPSSDDPGDWQAWLNERKKDKDTQAKIKELEKDEKDKDKKKSATEASSGDSDAPTASSHANSLPPPPPPTDLGPISRVVFKNGSTLLCYILTRRTDADGNLISIRVAHPDGAGEETLTADMIARIEDDARH
jgi:hypothetical protein